ncbi:hypothetical protein, partial [Bacillus pumilus]|uniref:hypothetical protein n=2 Tax=Bacillaceae TaxID=186817 RepID=UPI001C92D47C
GSRGSVKNFYTMKWGEKIKKKSPPAGKFGLVFGLLGFEVLVFKKMAVSPAFWAILTESESCLFLS